MTNYARIAGLVLTAVALTTTPALAQRNRRDGGGDSGRRDGGRDSSRRDGGRDSSRRDGGRDTSRRDGGGDRREGGQLAIPRPRESQRPTVIVPRGGRPTYVVPSRPYAYSYRPYAYRAPYGYRPNGYRPGWSLGLYFGAPYYAYGYPGYSYGPSAGYGYYDIVPGRAYGAVRIVDAPRDAQVFVDGYYAGVVDDYDGVFQHLNLEAGAHRIEIQSPYGPPITFDVRVRPGETLTYHARPDRY